MSQAKEHHRAWNADAMRTAIGHYRGGSGAQQVLDLAGVDREADRVLELQRALALAGTRVERDALEDIAFEASTDQLPCTAEFLAQVRGLVDECYGPNAAEQVGVNDMVRALARAVGDRLPANAAAAAIGIEIDRAVNNSVRVDPGEFGTTIGCFHTHCADCGGASGGKGVKDGEPCACSSEVGVPAAPRDGQVVRGVFRKSGQRRWFTLRLS